MYGSFTLLYHENVREECMCVTSLMDNPLRYWNYFKEFPPNIDNEMFPNSL